MIKRTLFFSSGCHLSVKDAQLVITIKEPGTLNSVPIEDIGFVVLDNQSITFTQSVIQHLTENNASIVFCDSKHHPASMLFHLDSNQTQSEKFRNQINAKEPLKKQLWQQTIKAKILNQAKLLEMLKINSLPLTRIAKHVKSGDPTNEESKAARLYWKSLLGDDFRRDRYGSAPNAALNYGYAILRAAVARSLAGSGLLSTIGIHHKNRYNAFCLADDVMEPYRPFVDKTVIELKSDFKNEAELSKESKAELLNVLTVDTMINKKKRPLMIALTETTASLARCFAGESNKLVYADFI